ncbi:hypothetical protein H6P81_009695 [Aristolochia fimbriata]|uniref:Uncharacterized protein n=1 Tax=Aristolochia fimbriata TaxID=158543 RepID=A0AAV7ELM6_ARIFI|nr:hypothetical protein H6P81_009695 [Aristolochia fimbriata]
MKSVGKRVLGRECWEESVGKRGLGRKDQEERAEKRVFGREGREERAGKSCTKLWAFELSMAETQVNQSDNDPLLDANDLVQPRRGGAESQSQMVQYETQPERTEGDTQSQPSGNETPSQVTLGGKRSLTSVV